MNIPQVQSSSSTGLSYCSTLVRDLKSIVLSNLPRSTKVNNAWCSLHQVIRVLQETSRSITGSIGNETANPRSMSKSVMYNEIPAKCLTVGDMIAEQEKLAHVRSAAKESRENAKVLREAAREKKWALRAIESNSRGERRRG